MQDAGCVSPPHWNGALETYLFIADNFNTVVLPHTYTTVGGTEINANCVRHCGELRFSFRFLLLFWRSNAPERMR
jgi:hypothetical protein